MGYTSAQAKAFIEHIAPMICEEADRRGYNIRSTVIAQAIVEGAAGTSLLAKRWHNHFGMKCCLTWKGTSVNLATKEEYTFGQLINTRANWRTYPDDMAGIVGYYDFISTKRYANLKYAKDYRQYAEYLKKDGWATSSTYVDTLCKTCIRYNLMVYDVVNTPIKSINEIALEVIDQKWGNGEDRKVMLKSAGYDYRAVQAEVNRILKEKK